MNIGICNASFSGLQVLILSSTGLQIRRNGEWRRSACSPRCSVREPVLGLCVDLLDPRSGQCSQSLIRFLLMPHLLSNWQETLFRLMPLQIAFCFSLLDRFKIGVNKNCSAKLCFLLAKEKFFLSFFYQAIVRGKMLFLQFIGNQRDLRAQIKYTQNTLFGGSPKKATFNLL